VILVRQVGRRHQQVQYVGQRLSIGADDIGSDVGEADRTDQDAVQVVLFVDDGLAESCCVVDRLDQIRRRIGVGVDRGGSDFEVVAQCRKARFDRGQELVRVTDRLTQLLTPAVERLCDRGQSLVKLLGSMDFSTCDSCSKTVLDSIITCSASSTCPAVRVCDDGLGGFTNSTDFAPNTVVDATSTRVLAGSGPAARGPPPTSSQPVRQQRVDGLDLAHLHPVQFDLGVRIHH